MNSAEPARLRVRFEPSGHEIELRAGERLLDVVDDQHVLGLLPTACRAGNCGACRVRVREGGDRLEPASATERTVLSQLGCARDERLGCQVYALTLQPAASDPRLVTFEIVRA